MKCHSIWHIIDLQPGSNFNPINYFHPASLALSWNFQRAFQSLFHQTSRQICGLATFCCMPCLHEPAIWNFMCKISSRSRETNLILLTGMPWPSPSEGRCWYDDVIKWKHFTSYWSFVRGIHRSLVNSLHKGQWRGAVMFSVICAWINGWVNNREAGDLRHHRAHYDVIVMGIL